MKQITKQAHARHQHIAKHSKDTCMPAVGDKKNTSIVLGVATTAGAVTSAQQTSSTAHAAIERQELGGTKAFLCECHEQQLIMTVTPRSKCTSLANGISACISCATHRMKHNLLIIGCPGVKVRMPLRMRCVLSTMMMVLENSFLMYSPEKSLLSNHMNLGPCSQPTDMRQSG